METTRRGFLSAIAAAFVLDPERLLFVPGKKLISIPARSLSIEEINEITMAYIAPHCMELIFRNSALFERMRSPEAKAEYKALSRNNDTPPGTFLWNPGLDRKSL